MNNEIKTFDNYKLLWYYYNIVIDKVEYYN